MKVGCKVKGIYFGMEYKGIIRKIRTYAGNDRKLMNYLMYYITLDAPFTDALGIHKGILIHEITKTCTIQQF